MKVNEYGATFLTEQECFNALYSGKIFSLDNIYLDTDLTEQFNQSVDLNKDHFNIQLYKTPSITVEEFNRNNQTNWYMPVEYKNFDIETWLVDQCKTYDEVNRITDELVLFSQYHMIEVLRYLKYLVDTMRTNNILWGVGRGSSVASYALYLIGVHKINSIKFNLDIKEFLK